MSERFSPICLACTMGVRLSLPVMQARSNSRRRGRKRARSPGYDTGAETPVSELTPDTCSATSDSMQASEVRHASCIMCMCTSNNGTLG